MGTTDNLEERFDLWSPSLLPTSMELSLTTGESAFVSHQNFVCVELWIQIWNSILEYLLD